MDWDFKPGDEVIIREWDDMAAEFGVIKFGDMESIDIFPRFNEHMKYLCGTRFTVQNNQHLAQGYLRAFPRKEDPELSWHIYTSMVRPIDNIEFEETDEIEQFFRNIHVVRQERGN